MAYDLTTNDVTKRTNPSVGPVPMSGAPVNPLLPKPVKPPTATLNPQISPINPALAPTAPSVPQTTPQPVQPTPQTPSGAGQGVGLTPTDPNRSLTTQTIVPGQTADRFQVAQQRFDQFVAGTNPAYQATLRDANRMGAAQGRLGSGSLRTDFGNLANQRNQQMDLARQGFLGDALEGSIGDAWRSIGLAERQQGFQSGQQEDAWRRALEQYQVGSQNNPYGARMDASRQYGAGAQGAYGALGDYWRNIGQTPPYNPNSPYGGG